MDKGDAQLQQKNSLISNSLDVIDEGPQIQKLTANDIKAKLSKAKEVLHTLQRRQEQYLLSQNISRPDEAQLSKLDTSVKRNRQVTKRLRAISEESIESILQDIAKVSLAKYVSELAVAIAENPFRIRDIPAILSVISTLHRRFVDFVPEVVRQLVKTFHAASEDDKVTLRVRKGLLCLLTDMNTSGMTSNLNSVHELLATQTQSVYVQLPDKGALPLGVLAGYGSAVNGLLGDEEAVLLGLQVDDEQVDETEDAQHVAQQLAETLEQVNLAQRKTVKLREEDISRINQQLLKGYQLGHQSLWSIHQKVTTLTQKKKKADSGMASERIFDPAEYSQMKKELAGLLRSCQTIADVIGVPQPNLPEPVDDDEFDDMPMRPTDWVHEEDRVFYAELLDLVDIFPELAKNTNILDQGSVNANTTNDATPSAKDGETPITPLSTTFTNQDKVIDNEYIEEGVQAEGASSLKLTSDQTGPSEQQATSTEQNGATSMAVEATNSNIDKNVKRSSSGAQISVEGDQIDSTGVLPNIAPIKVSSEKSLYGNDTNSSIKDDSSAKDEGKDGTVQGTVKLDELINNIPNINTKEKCDDFCVSVCKIKLKGTKKKVLKALLLVPKFSLQLVPFQCRMIATLAQIWPEYKQDSVDYLWATFHANIQRNDPNAGALESKIRNTRQLAELTKFSVVKPMQIFKALKQLMENLVAYNVDALCVLIEVAGPYLLRNRASRARMNQTLETLERIKKTKNLSARQISSIENSIVSCKMEYQGAGQTVKAQPLPPIKEYIRYLLFQILGADTVDLVSIKLLRLPWPDYEDLLISYMVNASDMPSSNIPYLAIIIKRLRKYHTSFGIALIDALLADIIYSLALPQDHHYQRHLAQQRLLGSLYVYRVLDANVILLVLRTILFYGYDQPAYAAVIDPPNDYYRIRLMVTMLSSVASYMLSDKYRPKLQLFMLQFQKYLLTKETPPLELTFDLKLLFEQLAPTITRYESIQELDTALAQQNIEIEPYAGHEQTSPTHSRASTDEVKSNKTKQKRQVHESQPQYVSKPVQKAQQKQEIEEPIDEDYEAEYEEMMNAGRNALDELDRLVVRAGGQSAQPVESAAQKVLVPMKIVFRKQGKEQRVRQLDAVPMDASWAAQVAANRDIEIDDDHFIATKKEKKGSTRDRKQNSKTTISLTPSLYQYHLDNA